MSYQLCRRFFIVVTTAMVLLASGCGSSGGGGSLAGGGIGGTGVTSGTVTGFGSVFVNGVEFETDTGTSFDVDDDPEASEADLGIGMVVTIIGTVNDDGVTGSADSIEYDEEIEGPITSNPSISLGEDTDPTLGEDPDGQTKTFAVFDLKVVVDRNTTTFVETDYDSLAMDDIVEVSGFFDESGKLFATRLEKELGGVNEVEVKGTVSGCGGDCTDSFTLVPLALDITYDGFTDLTEVPGNMITDGQFVEVKGVLDSPSTIAASRIELEDEGFGEDVDKVSIEGLVTDFNGLNDFKVSGQPVDASGADFSPQSLADSLGDGDKVEVEGPISGGVLQAVEVEQRGGSIKIGGQVTGVDVPGTTLSLEVVMGQPAITVITDTQTKMEDDELGIEPFSLADIVPDDEIILEGYLDSEGNVVATQLQRKVIEKYELQGPVEVAGGDDLAGSVTILGVTIRTDDSTGFEAADESGISGMEFYDQVVAGDLVEFADNVPEGGVVDGIADEVGFED